MAYKQHSVLVPILKWTVTTLILLNIAALITLPWWLNLLYTDGYTSLLSGGYFLDTTVAATIRGDYPLMLRFLAICGIFSLIALIFAFMILTRLSHSEPFHPKNARDLRTMGFTTLGIVAAGIYKLCYEFTLYSILFVGVFLLASIFLFILAQIFDEACQIKSENDLVI